LRAVRAAGKFEGAAAADGQRVALAVAGDLAAGFQNAEAAAEIE
jgi:hypothetical protein